MVYPKPVEELIDQLRILPAIGPRSAERIALWLLLDRKRNPVSLAEALVECEKQVGFCSQCGFFAEKGEDCSVCNSSRRTSNAICVVEKAPDVIALERSGAFNGKYHCLGGVLSPLDGIHPEDLRIESLIHRVDEMDEGAEVILAIGVHIEGEATSSYLEGVLKDKEVKVTRLARGLPVGANLEFADQLTLTRAFEGRLS